MDHSVHVARKSEANLVNFCELQYASINFLLERILRLQILSRVCSHACARVGYNYLSSRLYQWWLCEFVSFCVSTSGRRRFVKVRVSQSIYSWSFIKTSAGLSPRLYYCRHPTHTALVTVSVEDCLMMTSSSAVLSYEHWNRVAETCVLE